MSLFWRVFLVVLGSSSLRGAPFNTDTEVDLRGLNTKVDSSVEELEKLKTSVELHEGPLKGNRQHLEVHKTDVVTHNGEAVSKVEEHSSAEVVPGEPPVLHSEVDIGSTRPGELGGLGAARPGEQDGDIPTTTPGPGLETTTKVFHGAARLVQPGTASQTPHRPAHLTVRRSYTNAGLPFQPLEGGLVEMSPLELSRYVHWTGDDTLVTQYVQDALRTGLMSKEEAISFLQEIKFNLEYLKARYGDRDQISDGSRQYLPVRNMMSEQPQAKEASQNRYPSVAVDLPRNLFKRTSPDLMLESNIIGTSYFDKEPPQISEQQYSEMMDKLRIADSLYTQYSLQEIIYELAKMMFSMSLSVDSGRAESGETREAVRRFTAVLQAEEDRGLIDTHTRKEIQDVLVSALSDSLGDRSDLLRLPHYRLISEMLGASNPAMSRAILSAYRDQLSKQPQRDYTYTDTQ